MEWNEITGITGFEKAAESIEQICIQAKIDMLEENTRRLKEQSKSIKDLINENSGSMSNARLEGKRSGIKIAIENIRQNIQELQSQLS